jgi:hypothetical protein
MRAADRCRPDPIAGRHGGVPTTSDRGRAYPPEGAFHDGARFCATTIVNDWASLMARHSPKPTPDSSPRRSNRAGRGARLPGERTTTPSAKPGSANDNQQIAVRSDDERITPATTLTVGEPIGVSTTSCCDADVTTVIWNVSDASRSRPRA